MSKLRLIVTLVFLFGVFGAGWESRGWYEGSQDSKALKTLAKQKEDSQQQSELQAQETNKAAANKRKGIEDEYAEIENEIRAAGDLGCMSDDVARLHHRIVQAVSGSHTARVRCDEPRTETNSE